jgi:CRP-like cAMP-binding protein
LAGNDTPSQVARIGLKRMGVSEFVLRDPVLKASGLLKELAPAVAERLLGQAVGRRFQDGAVLFQRGDSGQSIFLVLAGEAGIQTVRDSQSVEVATVRKGDVLGEAEWVTQVGHRTQSAVARGVVDVAEVPVAALDEAAHAAPALATWLRALHEQRQSAGDEMSDFLNRW